MYEDQVLVDKKRARCCYTLLKCNMVSYEYNEMIEKEIVLQPYKFPVCIYYVDDEIYITYTPYFNYNYLLTGSKILWESEDNLTKRVLDRILN